LAEEAKKAEEERLAQETSEAQKLAEENAQKFPESNEEDS